MKMRKLLSFVLVLSLVLGSFSMAFAATPASTGLSDIAGIANEEAIQVNNDLGIITGMPDGTFMPEKAVTRAEFAAMITRALAIPESALAGYSATSFKDMTGYTWATGYISFCASKGIMLGDGAGNAMPGKTITVNEAMTMVLRAVGYVNNSAELVGTWPANYVTVAQNVGLYDDVAKVVSVDRANAAQIIYNALTVQKVAVNSDGETKYLTYTDTNADDEIVTYATTLLTSGLDCEGNEEVVTNEDDSLISLIKYVGAKANVYRNDGGEGDIVAVEVTSTFLTGEYDGDGTFEADNGTDYTVTAGLEDNDVFAFENATGVAKTSLSALGIDDTVTIAVKVSGKTIKELYSIAEWTVTDAVVASDSDIEDMDDQEFAGIEFTTDDNGDIDLNSFALVGAASLDKIAKDDVVYIYTDDNETTGEIVKIAVGTATIDAGKVTEQDGSDWTIAGKVYVTSGAINNDIEDFKVGDTVNAKLDAYGDIFELEIAKSTPDMYGIVKAYAIPGVNDAQVKLYTSADATKTFNIDEDADGDAITTASVLSLMGYSLDKDGVIDGINLDVTTGAAATLSSIKVINVDGDSYAVAKDCVVFTIDGENYDMTTIADVETGANIAPAAGFQMIIDEEDGDVVAMLIDDEFAGAASDDTYGVINKVVVAIDADDEAIQKLTGFAAGTAFTKYTDDDKVTFGLGDITLWNFDLDSEGIIVDATPAPTEAALYGANIADLNSDKSAVKIGSDWYAIADTAVVYVAELNDDGEYEYAVSSKGSIRDTYAITLFETDDKEDGYDFVVFEKPVL